MIRRNHPLAKGLVSAFIPKLGPQDLIQRTTINYSQGQVLKSHASIERTADTHLDFGTSANYSNTEYTIFVIAESTVDSSTTDVRYLVSNNIGGDYGAFTWSHTSAAFEQAFWHSAGGGSFPKAALTTNLVADTIYTLCGTYDGVNVRAYLNGALEATTAGNPPVGASTTLTVGADSNNFDGTVYRFYLYDRALSDDEVADLTRNPDVILQRPNQIYLLGSAPITGTGAADFGALTGNASGTAYTTITGTGTATFGAFTADASGAASSLITGTGNAQFGVFTANASDATPGTFNPGVGRYESIINMV